MSAQSVSRFIDELKSVVWALSDDELASALKVGKSTIATWRRRGSVPAKVQRELFIKYGVDYCLIATGEPCDLAQSDRLFKVALYAAILKLGNQLNEAKIEEVASWLASHEAEFRAHILDGAVFDIPDPFSVDAYKRVLTSVLEGSLATLATFERLRDEILNEQAGSDDVPEFPT